MQQKLGWEVGFAKNGNELPTDWHMASVPGAVQEDLLPTLERQDWYFSDHVRQFEWMEDVYWYYRATFRKPQVALDESLYLFIGGIDYSYRIQLNGREVFKHEGMFSRFEIELGDELKETNELLIIIDPVPKSMGTPSRDQASKSVKPAVSYGWDWHPRLVSLGIWEDIWLKTHKSKGFKPGIHYRYQLEDDPCEADIRIEGSVGIEEGSVVFSISEGGDQVFRETFDVSKGWVIQTKFSPGKLWWPYELGEPFRYDCKLELRGADNAVIDQYEWKWGFRKAKLIMNEGAWDEPSQFPKSRSYPPITLEINGQRLFAKGTNWVNPEIFPGKITDQRYEALLTLAKEMHFNILRVWGGGIVNKDYFHEWCDAHGMLTWQEFPLACVNYEDDPGYLKTLEVEATSIIRRLRNYASTVLWCGGNELFNSWSGMTDQSAALRLLNALCLEHDPGVPFIPTSPVAGMGHGHYLFWDSETNEDVFQLMYRSKNTAYTEFGMPSPSSVATLQKIIPAQELKVPVENTGSWRAHHAFEAWIGNTWLCEPIIRKFMGDMDTLDALVQKGQELQAIGYRAVYEMARQQWPYCSMALNWCYGEPWPAAANNSIVEYFGFRKPATEAIKMACRPQMVSARFPKYEWNVGELFYFDLFFFNHHTKALIPGDIEVWVNGHHVITWHVAKTEAYQNAVGPQVKYKLKPGDDALKVDLVTADEVWNSTYTLKLKKQEDDPGQVLNM